ncbi:MAG: TolC family protein, partial [Myxococcales bacterium]|nr:TolC family protein [Myxococcales bacterium]
MKRALTVLLSCLSLVGCVSQQAGYGDLKQDVRTRTGKEVRWYHLDGTKAAEQRIRELVKQPLDQEAAVQIALLNNPRIQAEFERIGMARADLVSAWKLPNPRLGADATFYGNESDPELKFDVTMSLTRLLTLPSRTDAADAGLDRARLEVLGATLDLSYGVRRAVIQFQIERSVLGLLRKQTGASNASYVAAKRLHEAGNLNDLELATEQAAYEEARLAVAEAELGERGAKLELGRLLGFWQLGTDFQVRGQLPALPPPSAAERLSEPAAEKAALEASVELSVGRARYAEATGKSNAARLSGALPDVSAGVGVERQDDEWGVGPAVHLEIPLFDQGQGALGRAESERRRARADSSATAAD